MDLFNYIKLLGKSLLRTCRCEETLPSLSHFMVSKYEAERHVYFKLNKKNFLKRKKEDFEETILN